MNTVMSYSLINLVFMYSWNKEEDKVGQTIPQAIRVKSVDNIVRITSETECISSSPG